MPEMTTYSDIRRFSPAFGLHRTMRRRLGIPAPVADRVVRRLNRLWNPAQGQIRRPKELSTTLAMDVPDADGYLRFSPGELPGSDVVVDACRALYEVARAQWSGSDPGSTKDFLISLVKDGGFAHHPDILRFVTSPGILATVSGYLGSVPRLASVRLWWTPPNESMERSQICHADPEDTRQLKLFLNIDAVTEDQGPLTLFSASASRPLLENARLSKRHFDDRALPESAAPIVLTGPAGGGAFVDTSRCLHYGSRGNRRDRIVLMAQYVDFYAPCVQAAAWAKPVSAAGLALTEPQKLALCIE